MKIDIAIITIREDEFTAVRSRFQTKRQRISGGRTYLIGEVKTPDEQTYTVAIARCSDQGTDASQRLAHSIIHHLDPQLILVVGIAGGIPQDEFTLGDVVVSTRIVNPNVDAWLADGTIDYMTRGGPPHPVVEEIVSLLPGEPQLANWADSIRLERPHLDPERADIKGDDVWRERVRKSLAWHFGEEQNRGRSPTFTIGPIISSNHLMKDPIRLGEILKTHRAVLAVEMEAAGVYEAAYGTPHYPVMAIRGISDIVGLQRDRRWTAYACQTAAAFTYALIMTLSSQIKPRAALPASGGCPYHGLDAFTENDHEFFFGRERDKNRLLGKLRGGSHFMAILGPSGSGKSSLVQAGLIVELRKGAVPGSASWDFILCRPLTDPFAQLTAQGLAGISSNLLERVQAWRSQHPEKGRRLVLVFDQFEELWTSCPAELAQAFVTQLTQLLKAPYHEYLTIIVILRDDFYSHIVRNEQFADLMEQSTVNILPRLRQGEFVDIIQKPANKIGLRFADGLVDAIVEDVLEPMSTPLDDDRYGPSTVLPLLEFALTELWEKQQDGELTHKAYHAIHGISGALAQWAENTYKRIEERLQPLARHIFTNLVYLDNEKQGLPDSRRRRTLDSLCPANSNLNDVRQVVYHLVKDRLLVVSGDPGGGQEWVEIIHDVLLREWELLRFWIESDRRFLSWRQEMERQAEVWVKADRDEDKLLRGRDLKVAENWLAERGSDLSGLVRQFIVVGRERQVREEERWGTLKEEAKQQRQVALVRQLATRAEEALNQQPPAQELSLLLAVEAMRRLPCAEANQALVRGLTSLLRQRAQLSHDGQIYHGNKHAHRGHVFAIAFSPDGRYLATASEDGSAGVWDTVSGEQASCLAHNGEVYAVTFSPDGRYLATASWDGTAGIWEVGSGHRRFSLNHEGMVRGVAFSPDGRYLATASWDGTAGIWEVGSGHRLARLKHKHDVHTVVFSHSGRLLVTASRDGTAKVWETNRWREIAQMSHKENVCAAVFSPDGRYVATASSDKTAGVWEAANGHPVTTMTHGSIVWAVAFSPDGRYLATASGDQTAGTWDATSSRPIAQMTHESEVWDVAFSPDGRFLATASRDSTARVWGTADGQLVSYLAHPWEVNDVAFSPDARYLATGTMHGVVGVWEMTSIPQRANLLHHHPVHEVIFSPDGNSVATASHDEVITIWGITPGHQLARMSHTDRVNALAFSPDGRLVASASSDQTAGVWEVASGNLVFRLTHEDRVRAVAFSPEGDLLVTASDDRTAKVWDVHSGQQLAHLIHDGEVSAVSFSPDGHSLATASRDGTARGWDVPGGQPRFNLPHEGSVAIVAFSPDGRYLVTGSSDYLEKIKVWDVQSRHQLASKTFVDPIRAVSFHPDGHSLAIAVGSTAQLEQWETWETDDGQVITLIHDDSVEVVTFSPDGHYLATASRDCSADVWEVTSGRQVARIVHKKPVHAVVFSPDGNCVATASEDGTVQIWLWQPEGLIAEACSRLTRNLTEEEWQQYLGGEPYRETCSDLP